MATAIRIALINTLAGGLVTGVAIGMWMLVHAARTVGLADRHSQEISCRITLSILDGSWFLHSFALAVLAVVVYLTIKVGPKKIRCKVLLAGVVVMWIVIMTPFVFINLDAVHDEPIYIDGYIFGVSWSAAGKALIVTSGLAIEIPSMITAFVFAALAFKHVKQNVSIAEDGRMKTAMLKFLITSTALNTVISSISLTGVFTALIPVDPAFATGFVSLFLLYTTYATLGLATILVPIILLLQFKLMNRRVLSCSHTQVNVEHGGVLAGIHGNNK